MYAYDTCGNLQAIPRGRTLVEKSLHRLLSPKSMLTAPDATVQEARLSLDNSSMQLHNGARVPLRWDGKSWYLDYFVRKNATDSDDVAGVQFADVVASEMVAHVADDDAACETRD